MQQQALQQSAVEYLWPGYLTTCMTATYLQLLSVIIPGSIFNASVNVPLHAIAVCQIRLLWCRLACLAPPPSPPFPPWDSDPLPPPSPASAPGFSLPSCCAGGHIWRRDQLTAGRCRCNGRQQQKFSQSWLDRQSAAASHQQGRRGLHGATLQQMVRWMS